MGLAIQLVQEIIECGPGRSCFDLGGEHHASLIEGLATDFLATRRTIRFSMGVAIPLEETWIPMHGRRCGGLALCFVSFESFGS